MDKSYEAINEFLNNPQNTDDFYENDTVIAIDWREDDEDIVKYFNQAIGNKIAIKMENNDKPYGDDIILTYKDKIVKIPMIGNENYKIKKILIKTRRLR